MQQQVKKEVFSISVESFLKRYYKDGNGHFKVKLKIGDSYIASYPSDFKKALNKFASPAAIYITGTLYRKTLKNEMYINFIGAPQQVEAQKIS